MFHTTSFSLYKLCWSWLFKNAKKMVSFSPCWTPWTLVCLGHFDFFPVPWTFIFSAYCESGKKHPTSKWPCLCSTCKIFNSDTKLIQNPKALSFRHSNGSPHWVHSNGVVCVSTEKSSFYCNRFLDLERKYTVGQFSVLVNFFMISSVCVQCLQILALNNG